MEVPVSCAELGVELGHKIFFFFKWTLYLASQLEDLFICMCISLVLMSLESRF